MTQSISQRWAVGLSYDGAHFAGWQRQKNNPETAQQWCEKAFSKVANAPTEVVGTGRTDARVHAAGYVAHFDSVANRTPLQWLRGANTFLPPSVRIHWVQAMGDDFHARFKAQARGYRYIIMNTPTKPALYQAHHTWIPTPLNEQAMSEALSLLMGEHDFSAFRDAQCQAKNPVRTLLSGQVSRHGHQIIVDVKGNAFLHHMVRNIVGTLLPIGQGQHPASWMQTVLDSKDRRQAGITAPPNGLYFTDVDYDAIYQIPPMNTWRLMPGWSG